MVCILWKHITFEFKLDLGNDFVTPAARWSYVSGVHFPTK